MGAYEGTPLPTSTTLALSSGQSIIDQGAPVTVSLVVENTEGGTSAESSIVPAGTASFYSNGALIASGIQLIPGSANQPFATASYTYTSLSAGADNLTAAYVPAAPNYGASSSNSLVETVNPALAGVSVNPTSVVGGSPSTGMVTLSGPAPTAGEVIGLSSNDPSATVPATLTVPTGQTSAAFTVATWSVNSQTSVTITATDPANSQQAATLTVNPAPPANLREPTLGASMSLGPEVISGNRVYIHGNAPYAELVTLTSSDSSAVRVPASVTVQPGASSRTFNINVVKNDPAETVIVTATYNGESQMAQISVAPAPISLKSVVTNPSSFQGGTSSKRAVSI